MGLFSAKTKEIEYDAKECADKKERMRQMFDEAVEEGEAYEILHATQTSSKFERGFIFDTTTTSFYHYIVGYRRDSGSVVMVQVDRELTMHSEAVFIDMFAVVGISYNPKYSQACLKYEKGYGSYGEILNIGDSGSKTMYGIANMVQKEERERFLDFLEEERSRLQNEGHKQEKWKR